MTLSTRSYSAHPRTQKPSFYLHILKGQRRSMRAVSQRTRSLLALRNDRTARMLVVICNVHLVSVAKVRAHPQQPSRLRLTLCRTRRSRSRCRTRRKFRSASGHACAVRLRQPAQIRRSRFPAYYICISTRICYCPLLPPIAVRYRRYLNRALVTNERAPHHTRASRTRA